MPRRVEGLEICLANRKHAALGNPEVAQVCLWRHGSRRTQVDARDYCVAIPNAKQNAGSGDEALAVRRGPVETHAAYP